ncbi:MAG: hypothetical protein C4288_17975 [Leptolyngbya sp. ERB_1_1]
MIAITKHLSGCTTVAFQAITLNLLLCRLFRLEVAETTFICHLDRSSIRIDRTLKGFIGYVGTHDSA